MRAFNLVALIALAMGLGLAGRAAAAPPPLEAYGQLPTIEDVALSPSGQRMALVVRDAQGGAKVYVRQIDGPVLMAAPVSDGFIDGVRFAGEDIVLVRVSNVMHEGINQLGTDVWYGQGEFAFDLATKSSFQVFKGVAQMWPDIWGFYGSRKVDGRWYGYYATQTCPENVSCGLMLYKVDLATGKPLQLDRSELADLDTQWMAGDAGEAAARLIYDSRNTHWTLTSILARKVVAEGDAGFGPVSLWGPGRVPGTVMVRTHGDGGYDGLFEVPLAGGAWQPVTTGREVQSSWTDPETAQVIGYTWFDDGWRDVLFDPLMQKRADAARAAFRGYNVRLVSASRDFGRIIAFTDGGDDSGTYWLVDVASGKASELGSAYPNVPPPQTGKVSLFRYAAADGLPLEAALTLPPGREAKALPLIVLAHGGPERRVWPEFDWLAQAFASRGYAVLAPNFRGSGDYGRTLRDAGFDQWGRKMQTDLSDAVDALAAAGMIDPKRACIVGVDYGGYAAAAGVTLQQGRYRCAVAYGGAYDLPALLAQKVSFRNRTTVKYWSQLIGYGKPDARLDELSPIRRAKDADAPIMVIDTKADWTEVIVQGPGFAQALKSAGKPVEKVALDTEDWRMRTAAARTGLLNAAVPFVEKYNPSDAP